MLGFDCDYLEGCMARLRDCVSGVCLGWEIFCVLFRRVVIGQILFYLYMCFYHVSYYSYGEIPLQLVLCVYVRMV